MIRHSCSQPLCVASRQLQTPRATCLLPSYKLRPSSTHASFTTQLISRQSSSQSRTSGSWQPGALSKGPKLVGLGLLTTLFTVFGLYVLNPETPRWSGQSEAKTPLHPNSFRTFVLARKDAVSTTSAILTLRPRDYERKRDAQENADAYAEFWQRGLWSIEVKQPQLQIARRYTPLPPVVANEEQQSAGEGCAEPNPSGVIRILVRREPEGEVSRFLHLLPVGAEVEVRGGYVEYDLSKIATKDNEVDLVFVAGGTGIAPAMQAAHFLKMRSIEGRATQHKMKLMWANRKGEDCKGGISDIDTEKPSGLGRWISPLLGQAKQHQAENEEEENDIVTQLRMLQHSWNASTSGDFDLAIKFFVDEQGTFLARHDVAQTLSRFPKVYATTGGNHRRRLLLISGPDGFVDYIAGCKLIRNGVEVQGPLGGLLSQVDVKGWEVHKL